MPSSWCGLGAEALGGKGGGGRPDMAQAGGPDPDHAEAALAAIEQALRVRTPEGTATQGTAAQGAETEGATALS